MAVGKQERTVTNIEKAVKELQDNLLVIAEIERRQTALLRQHSELHAESEEFRRRTEQNLAEISDKLNGLIGYMDGMRRPPSQS
jgi:predicted  nucleic acid-binding Zn-ribbon protein